MPRGKRKRLFDEKSLSKAQLRKLNALRKGMIKLLGEGLGSQQADKAFTDWLVQNPAENGSGADPSAQAIAEALWPLVKSRKVRIGRSGYSVKRGRGRLLVEPLQD